MWLRGPRFLVAWNIHVLCNSSCAMRGIITRGTGHTRNSQEWNTCRHKRPINIRYSSAINLQNMSNSVHNYESRFHMNYQGNGLIVHV